MRILLQGLLITSFAFMNSCQTISKRQTIPSEKVNKVDMPISADRKDLDNIYLEEINGKKALQWVEEHNKSSRISFESDPRFKVINETMLKILDDPNKLVHVSFVGDWAYNYWKDAKNVRGLWRRTSIAEYLKGKRRWEVLLDLDELAKKENKNWIFGGADRFKDKAFISLSDGGKDAKVIREFDLRTKSFVNDGYILPEGKNDLTWINENEAFLGLALGENEVTESGYSRQIRLWKRGEPFTSAKIVFSGDKKDVAVSAFVSRDEEDDDAHYKVLVRGVDFFNSEKSILRADGSIVKLPIPNDAEFDLDADQIYLNLKSDWHFKGKTYNVGSLVRLNIEELLLGQATAELVFAPTKTQFIQQQIIDHGRVFLILSNDVTSLATEAILQTSQWNSKKILLPENSSIGFAAYSKKHGLLTFSCEGFLASQAIYSLVLSSNTLKQIDQAPSHFDPAPFEVKQLFVNSKDGTRVPYYMVHKKGLKLNGKNPTIIRAYGGFEISLTPSYLSSIGPAWLKNGGVWIVANLRGGGEYGPAWHTSVIKQNRQRVYEDFFAVAEDVILKKITSPERLGAVGGSNGGLLMGVAMTQRPDLFNAIAIQVPLLDMLRFHKLLSGASWVGEYGDPEDPNDRQFIEAYSPYQNIKSETRYPKVFFMTSTADDRVHPGHARRTAAKMEEQGHPFFYYENTEGGHGGSANNTQSAKWTALQFVYFLQMLK